MTYQDLPSRQKSQRLINRLRTQQNQQQFQQYKQRARTITNINELLPGLNDISDAFEALPLDLIKYSTLLKEIDAKCINTVPQINFLIERYIDDLHGKDEKETPAEPENGKEPTPKPTKSETEVRRLTLIKDKINEIIPCLEEKMHVTSVASELLNKHMFRINNDYKLIISNNEIPESIRIGPLNHPAMIMDSSSMSSSSADRSAQSQRSESRREALAAKKANKEDLIDDGFGGGKKKRAKESTPLDIASAKPLFNTNGGNGGTGSGSNTSNKKRPRKEMGDDIQQRPSTPGSAVSGIAAANPSNPAKKKSKPKKEDENKNGAGAPNIELETRNGNDSRFRADSISQPNTAAKSGAGEPTYCYCNQVSFGEMVGCDGDDCKREWFHLPCIGFKNPPKGKWYCDDCLIKMKKLRKV